MKIELIDEWKDVWKYFTTHLNILAGSACLAYVEYYDKLKETIPPEYMAGVTGAMFFINIFFRILNQKNVK